MAVTPTNTKDKFNIFLRCLNAMGHHTLQDWIDGVTVSAGVPDTELASMMDYALVYDTTNGDAYIHRTGTTFTKINA